MRDSLRRLPFLSMILRLAGCAGPQLALGPADPSAWSIHLLGIVMYVGATIVTLLVTVLLLWPILRRQRRANHNLFLWSGGVGLLSLTLAALVRYVLTVGGDMRTPTLSNHLMADVTGHVYWWEMSYCRLDGHALVTSANELRLPVGKCVEEFLRSADVIHSFWVPNLAGKMDMIPGRATREVFQADRPGVDHGQCAECGGAQHARSNG